MHQELDISKLSEGQELRNYRELCKTLGIAVKGGDQKKAQMKEIGQYVDITRRGHRLIIQEIYKNPKIGTSNGYNNLIQLLLTDYFLDKKHVVASKNFLLLNVNMINTMYSTNRNNKESYAEKLNVDNSLVYDFFNTTDDTLQPAIETALRNLRSRSLIMYSWEPIVIEGGGKHRVATLDEREVLLKAEQESKKQMGYDSFKEIILSVKKVHESRRIQADYLLNNGHDIQMSYMGYSINILPKEMAKAQEKMIITILSDEEREDYRSELNSTIMSRLLKNAKNRRNKAVNLDESASEFFRAARSRFDYIEKMEQIARDNIKEDFMLSEQGFDMLKTMSALSSEPFYR